MADYILSCCSTADITHEFLDKNKIEYISYHYSINDVEHLDDLGKSLSHKAFYQLMREGAETKTSQVNVDEFVKYFEKFLKDDKDIIHISLSSGLSGTYNSARIAKETLMEKYPNRKIFVVDSLCASSGYGLLMDKLAEKRDEGLTIDELYSYAEENKLRVNHWFYSTDLSYYVKGGRITKVQGLIGTLLNIYPLLHVDDAGKLIPVHKVVGRKRVIKRIVEQMEIFAKDGLDYNEKCFISHADFIADANDVKEKVEVRFKKLKGRVQIYNIGTTIGSHTGPGTLALFFFGDKR